LKKVALQPGMFMREFDLRELEIQLHGFEAGLSSAGVMGDFEKFNRLFCDFLLSTSELSCSQGWAMALLSKYGQSERTFGVYQSLLQKATSESSMS
jgi:hypothetical protein